jgi:hypothetical protein
VVEIMQNNTNKYKQDEFRCSSGIWPREGDLLFVFVCIILAVRRGTYVEEQMMTGLSDLGEPRQTALEYLQNVYRDPSQPDARRMRAAA